jgi:hypothetical protein
MEEVIATFDIQKTKDVLFDEFLVKLDAKGFTALEYQHVRSIMINAKTDDEVFAVMNAIDKKFDNWQKTEKSPKTLIKNQNNQTIIFYPLLEKVKK